jgi:hypothetical protein
MSKSSKLLLAASILLELAASAQVASAAYVNPAFNVGLQTGLAIAVHCANNHGKGCDGPPPAPEPPGCSAGCGPVKDFRS